MSTSGLGELKKLSRRHGQHFFDDGAMRFFDSRVEAVFGMWFVTSEQFHGSDGRSAERLFTVRRMDPMTGKVTSVSGFQGCKTLDEALQALKVGKSLEGTGLV